MVGEYGGVELVLKLLVKYSNDQLMVTVVLRLLTRLAENGECGVTRLSCVVSEPDTA